MKKWMCCLAVTSVWLISSTTFACSVASTPEFLTDGTLPAIEFSAFDVTVDAIKRGNDTGSSCDDLGWIDLQINNEDTQVGYKVELIDGVAPKNLGVPQTPVSAIDSQITLIWSDEPTEEQPALDFTLRVTAIAPNGDEGPFEDVVVSDPGRDGGCSTTGEGDISVVSLFMFGLVVLGLRRIQ